MFPSEEKINYFWSLSLASGIHSPGRTAVETAPTQLITTG